MKKLLSILIIIFLVACSTKKPIAESKYKIGRYKIDKDSLSIITPYIEIKEKSDLSFIKHPDKRKVLTDLTISLLQSQYPNTEYIKVPFLFQDYGTINSKIEGRGSSTKKDVPKELLTEKNKYSIFISINGYFGDINRGIMMLFLIDNRNGKWKMIERYVYNNSPLDLEKTKRRILKSLGKIK